MSATRVLRQPELVAGFEQVGHSDQGGRPDAMQLQYWRDHVYVGHLFSGGFSVIDVSDPRQRRATWLLAGTNKHLEYPSSSCG